MSDRKRAIETLKQLRLDYEEFYEEHNNEVTQAYDMAISSLETDEAYQLEYEPTAKNNLAVDAISRQAINGYIDYILSHGMGKKKSFDFIKKFVANLPPVTPQEPRWILTTERLPKDRDWYLGIFKEPDTGWINPLPFICDYVGRETKATTKEFWILRGFTDRDVRDCDYYFNLECVKWMPLPQNYGEVEE